MGRCVAGESPVARVAEAAAATRNAVATSEVSIRTRMRGPLCERHFPSEPWILYQRWLISPPFRNPGGGRRPGPRAQGYARRLAGGRPAPATRDDRRQGRAAPARPPCRRGHGQARPGRAPQRDRDVVLRVAQAHHPPVPAPLGGRPCPGPENCAPRSPQGPRPAARPQRHFGSGCGEGGPARPDSGAPGVQGLRAPPGVPQMPQPAGGTTRRAPCPDSSAAAVPRRRRRSPASTAAGSRTPRAQRSRWHSPASGPAADAGRWGS